MTASTVATWVAGPRAASQSRNAASVVALTESVTQPSQMWWNTIGTNPQGGGSQPEV